MARNKFNGLRVSTPYHVYAYSLILGVVVGIAAIIFTDVLHLVTEYVHSWEHTRFDRSDSIGERLMAFNEGFKLRHLLIVLIPAAGGLISGLITARFGIEMMGSGMDYLVHGFHFKGGYLRPKNAWVKALATIFTVGSGGSGGREGPIAVIGASMGVWFSELLKAGKKARRTFLLSGASAGLSAVFKAPLGGALTTVEMIYTDDIESEALIPCFFSSVSAFMTYTAYNGTEKLFNVGEVSFSHLEELIFYLLLGVLCFVFAWMFLGGFRLARRNIKVFNMPSFIKPAIGGLLVGIISLFFYEMAGLGENVLQVIFNGKLPLLFGLHPLEISLAFLALALLKAVASNLTIGSGGSAGIFGPSLFIGAMLGGAVGTFAQFVAPQLNIHIASYMMVGMGAFYAGVASASLAGIIMVCEMTGNYLLLPPLILVTIFTRIISRKLSHMNSQLKNRFVSPAHFNRSDATP